jgi:nucleoside-diphosphate-sugar epimerase
VIRFSNVFGSIGDHPERVISAFTKAVTAGRPLYVQGRDHVLGFVSLEDTVQGLMTVVDRLELGEVLSPPVHVGTGRGTSLDELAAIVVRATECKAPIIRATLCDHHIARFVSDPRALASCWAGRPARIWRQSCGG